MASFKDKFLQDLEELSDEELKNGENMEGQDGGDESSSGNEEDEDFAEYREREEKVEKLVAKGYQSKIRGADSGKFREHIEAIESDLRGEKNSRFENLSMKAQA